MVMSTALSYISHEKGKAPKAYNSATLGSDRKKYGQSPMLCSIDKSKSTTAVESSHENADIMRWYASQNFIISPKICIKTVGGLRGIFATSDLCAGEGVAAIPPNMIIRSQFSSLDDALQSVVSDLADETRLHFQTIVAYLHADALDNKSLLAFRLLELLHDAPDVWQPYRQLCLPARVPNFYSMTTRELAQLLDETPACAGISAALAQEQLVVSQAEAEAQLPALMELLALLLPRVATTRGELQWAMSIAQSRAILAASGAHRCCARPRAGVRADSVLTDGC
jgi:hypothetical protein